MAVLAPARNLYLDALNQVRSLCLFSLIFIHALSFSTFYTDFPIRELPGLIPIYLLSGLNALFILLSGVTFRLLLQNQMVGDRLQRGSFLKILNPLSVLLLIETVKDLLLDQTLTALMYWNFLKTLWWGWILIYLLSRLNVYLNILVALAIAGFYPTIRTALLQFQSTETLADYAGSLWTAAHSQIWLYGLFMAIVLAVQIYHARWPLPLKRTAFGVLGGLVLVLAVFVLRFRPDVEDFEMATSWWLDGLVGDAHFKTMMPLLVWGPSYLLGFAGTHLVLRYSWLFRKFPSPVYFLLSLAIFALLFKTLILDHLSWLLSLLSNTTWNEFSNAQTNLGFELLKVAMFAVVFYFCVVLNQSRKPPPWTDAAQRWAQASFWIYILVTSWSRLAAQAAAQWTSSLGVVMLISFVSTLVLSFAVVQVMDFFGRKRIFLTLKKNPDG